MKVRIICPTCKTSRYIDILDVYFKNCANGILSVSIDEGFVCKHHFQAFIDKQGGVRGYQKIDLFYKEPSLSASRPQAHESIRNNLDNFQKSLT